MRLETRRMLLRPFEQSDLSYFITYGTNPEFYRYLPVEKQTEEDIRIFFDARMEEQEKGSSSRYSFAVVLKEGAQTIGSIRIGIVDANDGIADIGYVMNIDFGGQGLMSEAVSGILPYIFLKLKMKEVWANIHRNNIKSCRLAERLKFTETRNPPSSLQKDCGPEFDKFYRLTLDDFEPD